jgi:hypothetical protein
MASHAKTKKFIITAVRISNLTFLDVAGSEL